MVGGPRLSLEKSLFFALSLLANFPCSRPASRNERVERGKECKTNFSEEINFFPLGPEETARGKSEERREVSWRCKSSLDFRHFYFWTRKCEKSVSTWQKHRLTVELLLNSSNVPYFHNPIYRLPPRATLISNRFESDSYAWMKGLSSYPFISAAGGSIVPNLAYR